MQRIGLQLVVLGHTIVLIRPVCSRAAYDRQIMTNDCKKKMTSHRHQKHLQAYLGTALDAVDVDDLSSFLC